MSAVAHRCMLHTFSHFVILLRHWSQCRHRQLFSAMRLNRPATPGVEFGASAGEVLYLAFSSLVLLEGELFDCMPSGLGHLLDLACLGSRLLQGPSVPLSVQPCVRPCVKSLKS